MIDISKAGATQKILKNGTKTDWEVRLGKELLYTLPKEVKVEATFTIRDSIGLLLRKAFEAGKVEASALAQVKLTRVVDGGNRQLEELKTENERLSGILENLLNSKE